MPNGASSATACSTCRAAPTCYREGKGGRHGSVDLEDAIARSCDVYFYGLAATLGVDRIAGFMARFGFGAAHRHRHQRREARPPADAGNGRRRPSSDQQDQVWFPGETVNFGVGQGYLPVTPAAAGALPRRCWPTRGHNFQPRLVSGVRDPYTGGGQVAAAEPAAGHRRRRRGRLGHRHPGHDRRHHLWHRRGQRQGRAATRMAGKTGTAQVFSVGQSERYNDVVNAARQRNERLRDHSWFIAFAPAEAPRIAVCVLVENGGFGASVAAPIARRVMDAYLLNRNPAAPRHDARHELQDDIRPRAPHAVGDRAPAGRAAARRSAAGRPRPDLRLRPDRAVQRLRPEPRHRPAHADAHRPRRAGDDRAGAQQRELPAPAGALAVRRRHPAADRRRCDRLRRQGRAALARPRRDPLPALRDHEARGADDGRRVPARAAAAAGLARAAGRRRHHPAAGRPGRDAAGPGHGAADRRQRRRCCC